MRKLTRCPKISSGRMFNQLKYLTIPILKVSAYAMLYRKNLTSKNKFSRDNALLSSLTPAFQPKSRDNMLLFLPRSLQFACLAVYIVFFWLGSFDIRMTCSRRRLATSCNKKSSLMEKKSISRISINVVQERINLNCIVYAFINFRTIRCWNIFKLL